MNDAKIQTFLISIIDELKTGKISEYQRKQITDLCLAYNKPELCTGTKMTKKDVMKYIIMGWYVYNSIGDNSS